MKTKILHWTSVLLASSALLLSACSEDNGKDTSDPTPVFPDMATLNILAGETSCNVSFTPNMDWTVSIPTDAETSKWFRLSDGVVETSSISGKASTEPVTIQVITTNQDVYDETPSCEVSLTMGGQTQVIAKVTRQTAAREFNLYASDYDELGEVFLYTFSGTDPLTKFPDAEENPETAPEGSVTMQWSNSSYQYVFKASSNFEWNLSQPAWMEEANLQDKTDENDKPYVQIRIQAKFNEETIDGAVGVLDFYDAGIDKTEDPGNNAHNKYYVQMPAFRDLIRFPYSDMNANFSFNADGKYVSQSLGSDGTLYDNLSTTVSSTKGLKFFVLVPDGYGGYYSYAANDRSNWVTIEDTWDENGEVFQQHAYTVSVAANAEKERTASLLALPQTVAAGIDETMNLDDQLLDASRSYDLKEEYKQYLYASITQDGASSSVSGFSISPDANSQHMFDNGSAKWEVIDSENYFYEDDYLMDFSDEFMNGVPIYRLTYNTEGCEGGSIILSIKGSFDYTFIGVSEEYLDAKWLSEESWSDMPGKTSMVVSMNANPCKTGVKGTIALYQGSQVVGRIVCVRNY